jgi:hypothetical protein
MWFRLARGRHGGGFGERRELADLGLDPFQVQQQPETDHDQDSRKMVIEVVSESGIVIESIKEVQHHTR